MFLRKLRILVVLVRVVPTIALAQATSDPQQSDPQAQPQTQAQAEPLQITEKEVRAVQHALFSRGLLAKQPNGVFDSATRKAVTEYQKREGLQETGKIDQPTVDKLGLTFPITNEDNKSKRKNGVLPKIGYAVKDGASATSKAVTGSTK